MRSRPAQSGEDIRGEERRVYANKGAWHKRLYTYTAAS